MMQPLYLVGPRGCGKTTIGMALAQATGFRFADTDRWLQSHVQMSVADIVEKEGWGGFRARETAALEAVSAPSTVVATGGGIILTEYNRRYMHRVGVVIYLCAPVSTLVNRLEAEPEADLRPTLTGKPLSEEVRECLSSVTRCIAKRHITLLTRRKRRPRSFLKLLRRCRPRRNGYREMSILNAHPE